MVSRKTLLIGYVAYVIVAVIVGVAVSLTATPTAPLPSVGLPNSTCPLDSSAPECGIHGVCMLNSTGPFCLCDTGFVWGASRHLRAAFCGPSVCAHYPSCVRCSGRPGTPWVWNGTCNYPLLSNVNVFLASFLGGGYGADWFLLARGGGGNGGYVAGGVFKVRDATGL